MDITDLEKTLYYLYSRTDRYQDVPEINGHLTKDSALSKLETLLMVQKLVRDGYATHEETQRTVSDRITKEIKEQYTRHCFFISYEGILLIESLPKKWEGKPYQYLTYLQKKKEKAARIESFPKQYWWALAIVTFFIGALADVGKEWLKHHILDPKPKGTIQRSIIEQSMK